MKFSRSLLLVLPLVSAVAALPQPEEATTKTAPKSLAVRSSRTGTPKPTAVRTSQTGTPKPAAARTSQTESPKPAATTEPGPPKKEEKKGEKKDEKKEEKIDWEARKYFHEPGGDDTLGHYDLRYFKGVVAYDEHRPSLRHLIRSYLTTFRELGVETWLAHGTLLGWWWNGRIMPWDYDLDVQVSSATLYYLGKHHNRTTHQYTYVDPDDGSVVNKTYLLDVNPHHIERGRGDGMNIIDARWIDISNGMFVDITGLMEREPGSQPGVWSCKNNHKYRTRDLYPMRESEFEGVVATVPYSFDRVLTDEYGMKSLVTTEWKGHHWEPELKEWIKIVEQRAENGTTTESEVKDDKKDDKREDQQVTKPEDKREDQQVTKPEDKREDQQVTEQGDKRAEAQQITKPEDKRDDQQATEQDDKREAQQITEPEDKRETQPSDPEEEAQPEDKRDAARRDEKIVEAKP